MAGIGRNSVWKQDENIEEEAVDEENVTFHVGALRSAHPTRYLVKF